ncbi:hypothetical protein [Melittangium boletus]|uniref:hypothetical protein n=1 Tax=Melittangium boletus TaxID=83453 RepID=UPI003DA1D481
MSARASSFALWGATLLLGCGGMEEPDSQPLGMRLVLSQAVADELGAFQVVVLPNGASRSCADLQRSCLNQQVKATEPLVIADSSGKTGRALVFPVQLGEGGTQKLDVNIPVGRDYAIVIEAVSRSSPPRFLGSSCNYLNAVSSRNEPFIAASIQLAAVGCNPTFPSP